MNMIMLTGNVGAEPEFKQYESGKRRVSFSVALDQFNKEGERVETFWLTCCAWDSVCDRLQRCQANTKLSGRKINLAGSLTQSSWTDTNTGERKSRILVNVQIFDLLPSARATSQLDTEPLSDAEIIFDGTPAFPQRGRYRRKSR